MARIMICLAAVVAVMAYAAATETPCQRELRVNTADYNSVPTRLGQRIPKCDINGDYEPKQCSGSQCYCVTKDGVTIDGTHVNIWEGADQNCKCSRDKTEYSALGMVGKMHRCLPNGNYEPVQCTGSVCYCADESGKQIGTATVNIGVLSELNC